MFKEGDRVVQVSNKGNYNVTQIGWFGVVIKDSVDAWANVKWEQYKNCYLTVRAEDLVLEQVAKSPLYKALA